MRYPELGPGFLNDILPRKEFYMLRKEEKTSSGTGLDPLAGKYLRLQAHQRFVRGFLNPNTPYRYLHLMHATGTGKTLAAISIAQEFMRVYRQIFLEQYGTVSITRSNYLVADRSTPSVFVLGYGGTKSAFIRELLRYPQFGFISAQELDELARLQRNASGKLVADVQAYHDFYTAIKRRIGNKTKSGFYKFFGYDVFTNRLFSSDTVDLTRLELDAGILGISVEDLIRDHIAKGTIQVNLDLLRSLEDSLLICDEVHHTYNMESKNKRGVAIQFVIESVPTLRVLTLSATLVNNKPSEMLEPLSYLNPGKRFPKKDYFLDRRTLMPGAREKIKEAFYGKISFLQSTDPERFPRIIFDGEDIAMTSGDKLDYLKFIECPMSEFHQNTLDRFIASGTEVSDVAEVAEPVALISPADSEETRIETDVTEKAAALTANPDSILAYMDKDDEKRPKNEAETAPEIQDEPAVIGRLAIPIDGYALYDMVFPTPQSKEYGIFRTSEVRGTLLSAPQEWREQNAVMLKKVSGSSAHVISGQCLSIDSLRVFSTKYTKFVEQLIEIFRAGGGKKMIAYHPRIRSSGVLQIQEILRINGIIDEGTEPTSDTICGLCGERLSKHVDAGNSTSSASHQFRAARFTAIHSDLKPEVVANTITAFNAPDNLYGQKCDIILGSRIIEEAHDFKAIRYLFVLSVPVHIGALLQFFGRAARTDSHAGLQPSERDVHIRVLISTSTNKAIDSPEKQRYHGKLLDYDLVQELKAIAASVAIDSDANYAANMTPELIESFFPKGVTNVAPVKLLGHVFYEPETRVKLMSNADSLALSTYQAYMYGEDEVRMIMIIIKRLFISVRTVWTYDDLWSAVRASPFESEVNTRLFAEGPFVVALEKLVRARLDIMDIRNGTANSAKIMSENVLMSKLVDSREKYVWKDGKAHRIVHMGEYYILFPLVGTMPVDIGVVQDRFEENVRNRKLAAIYRSEQQGAAKRHPRIDAGLYETSDSGAASSGLRINIAQYVQSISIESIVETAREDIANDDGVARSSAFMQRYSSSIQIALLKEAIAIKSAGKAIESPEWTSWIVQFFANFGAIVFMKELARYTGVHDQFSTPIDASDGEKPMGIVLAKTIIMYDNAANKWISVSKISMNRHITEPENIIIIGMLEDSSTAANGMKFKLRAPIKGAEARTSPVDARLVERGIVCATKNKVELLELLNKLRPIARSADMRICAASKSAAGGEKRIKSLCSEIYEILLAAEMRERAKSMRARPIKYFYGWWDEMPSMSMLQGSS